MRILIFFLFLPLAAFSKKKELTFSTFKGDAIIKVFVLENPRAHATYVMRLHESGTAELNKYTNGKKPAFRQVTGKFRDKRRSISFQWKNTSEINFFPSKLYKSKNGLHYSMVDAIRGEEADIEANEDSRFRKVCYIDPVTNTLIRDKDFAAQLEVDELALAITEGAESKEEKIAAIVQYMCGQFKYGEGEQKDLRKILAQQEPRLVCMGYAEVFFQLAVANGIEVRKETGNVPNHVALALATGGEGHMWNVVRLNGEDRIVDVCWIDGLNGEDPLRSAYYLAAPQNVAVTHNSGQAAGEQFRMKPYVQLLSSNRAIEDFLPKEGVAKTEGSFRFVPVGVVKEKALLSATWFDISFGDVALEGEKNYNNLRGEIIGSYDLMTGVPVDVVMKNKSNGFLRLETEGISVTYMVVNGKVGDLYSSWFKRRDNKHLISYTRTIISGILLGDVAEFNEMIGNTTNVKPYVIRSGAMEEVRTALKDWTGEIESLTKITGTSELIPEGETHVYSVLIPGQIELLFSGEGSGGYGLRSIRAPFIKK
ncbi:MAG TPA: transglutaminase domain-containing protein [Flavobacteriales bacterium]|nr:transglutaminase domain-containing protein [Flavobacteriales bacterium]HRE95181.1 transglutaminase domain-containing protein [Flavobacteriales bacterium]HRJ38626.1 transglutaminase domain-containing protein [Flavobacteriales bacterium]